MESISRNRKTGLVFSLGIFVLPLLLSLNGSAEDMRISVARIGDIDRMDLPVTETLISWLETEFSERDDIIVDSMNGSFPASSDGVELAVADGRTNGMDIVLFGSYQDMGTKVQLELVSVISTVGFQMPGTITMPVEGEDCLDIALFRPGSPAPDVMRFYFNLIVADWMARSGEYEDAFELLDDVEQFIEAAPEEYQAIAWIFKGDLNLLLERYGTALDAYTAALALFPEDTYLLSVRATCFDAMGDRESALYDLLVLAELDPDNAATIGQLGAEFYQSGQYDDALLYLDHAIALDPSNAMTFRDRARLHYQLGDYDRALSDLDEALLLEPGSSQGLAFQGVVLHLAGDQQGAIEAVSAAIELERDLEVQAWSYYIRANCYISLEDYESALSDLTASLECSGSSYTVLYLMGVCFKELGEPKLAVVYLNEYISCPIEISPMDPWTTEDLHEKAESLLEELDQTQCVSNEE